MLIKAKALGAEEAAGAAAAAQPAVGFISLIISRLSFLVVIYY